MTPFPTTRARLVSWRTALVAVALVCASMAAVRGVQAQRQQRIDARVAALLEDRDRDMLLTRPDLFVPSRPHVAESAAGDPDAVRIADALALQRRGRREIARTLWQSLVDSPDPHVRDVALYDLCNDLAREAFARRDSDQIRHSPLISVAKQGYRELLARHPDDWDVRHNLELLLQISPERRAASGEQAEPAAQGAVRPRAAHGGFDADLP